MKFSLNIQGELKEWNKPAVMGILNLTPDSFFDGGRYLSKNQILTHLEQMINDGADIIDIGAFSSRPGAKMISEKEELERITKPLEWIQESGLNCIISIDTYRRKIAEAAITRGAAIINDITAGSWDKELPLYIAEEGIPYIIMHMQGKPESMQESPQYEDVSKEIYQWFSEKLIYLDSLGIKDLIIDPGFGFGKTLDQNYQLLNDLSNFKNLNKLLLVGLSRKGMIQKVIKSDAINSLNGTTAAHVLALLNGANILRVHDVKAAKEAVAIVDYYQNLNIA